MNTAVCIIAEKQNLSIVNLRLGGAIMATKAQIAANRRNARKSTGPRTPQGKAAVAKNPVKHGLFARQALIDTEDHAEFDLYRDHMLEDLAPVGPLESALAERIVTLYWRLRRAACTQNQTIETLSRPKPPTPLQKSIQALLPKACLPLQPDPADADPELAAFIRARIDRMTFHQLAAAVAAHFPPVRRVGKSAIHSWWQRQRG
jgi:hypothetical protein